MYPIVITVSIILVTAVHLSCAVSVNLYANSYSDKYDQLPILLPKFIWVLLTLISGLPFGVLFYILHCSMLNENVYQNSQRVIREQRKP